MKNTWNQHIVKKRNKQLVFNMINSNDFISRADIAQKTGLNKGTVSSLVSELIDDKLISESGFGKSSGGRRPVMLHINENAGYSIGIDLGVNYFLGILTNFKGEKVFEHYFKLEEIDFNYIIENLISMIDLLISKTPKSPYGVIGIGIGVPGSVDNEGNILLAPNLNWTNIDLKEILNDYYDYPILIENEANAGVYGEKINGIGQTFTDIIYISIGAGIGVGLILNDQLYRGSKGVSGELGHMTIDFKGDKCPCGNIGCWELYASEQSLKKHLETIKPDIKLDKYNEFERLIEAALNKDKIALQAISSLEYYISIGIKNIINTFNPQQIIIGGRISLADRLIEKSLQENIKKTLWFQQDGLDLKFSMLKKHSTAIGMVSFVFESFTDKFFE